MAADLIERYLAHLVDVVEGPAFTNNPTDRGGPTKYGVTQRALSSFRGAPVSAQDVQRLTRDEALRIYRADYVTLPGFDKLTSTEIALECIDTGVNMGPAVAAGFLQRTLNVFGAALVVDQNCGPKTVAALSSFIGTRGKQGEASLLVALNCLQGCRYVSICESDSSQRKFVNGWFNQRIQVVPDMAKYR